MQVMLQLQPDAAQLLRNPTRTSSASAELLQKARELGVALRPLLAASANSPLATGFSIVVPDRATADRVIESLRRCVAVEAAYLQPPTELP